MKLLSNEALVETYVKAVDLNLERDFIDLLFQEIKRRKLNVTGRKHANLHLTS
ncbi:sporulation histidine kinase inhibitor Sda [Marinicrinis lubricantis]|uniref:Sporulation histidine kinase inhibitor Sda n=1 Tax=Marinicrinis lubricantis TaxID=2086470 RepID=A0ABW1IUJ0_9BACL